ncbi:arylsulfatase [Roseateles microcysteis]|uniref:arylsulfatase n=1 Tax=Roseateles microcysteis TaxID=3119057 RepID=UPI002FE66D10
MTRLTPFMALALVGFAGAAPTPAPDTPRRPNIVVFLADDWGFSDVGAFGGEIATPNLDALARRGMRFSNFHVSASCSPTRSMLLTGVDNHRNGVGNMREAIPLEHLGQPGYLSVLKREVVTVASLLRDSGYRTYVAGKWHVGKEPYNLPDQRGFDRSLIQGDSGSDNWETGKRYLDLNDQVYWYEDGKPAKMPADYYSSEYFVDRAIDYIRSDKRQQQPFFAYVAFQANHIPLQAPKAFIDKYKGRYDAGWDAIRQARRDRAAALGLVPPDTAMVRMSTTADWASNTPQQQAYDARRMEVYAAMAEAMDHHVGRLVDYLKQTGQYDNTVFLFLSDNGSEASDPYEVPLGRLWLDWQYKRDIDSLGAKGAYTVIGPSWGSAAASPLATYKFYSGEGGIRVPLIVAGVPDMPADKVQNSFTHINDIVPTLLELAGTQHPGTQYRGQPVEPIHGRSLLPALRGEVERVHPADEPVGYELSGNEALFKGDLKLIRNIPPVGDGQWHLYDIRRDPGETTDLKAQRPEVFRQMLADYEAYAKANGVLPMPPDYEPRQQVMTNAIHLVYIPRYRAPVIAVLLLIGVGLGFWIWRRRRAR